MTSSAQSQQFPVSLVYKWPTLGLIFNCGSKDGYAKWGRGEGETPACATLRRGSPALKDEQGGVNPPHAHPQSLFCSFSISRKASECQPQASGELPHVNVVMPHSQSQRCSVTAAMTQGETTVGFLSRGLSEGDAGISSHFLQHPAAVPV